MIPVFFKYLGKIDGQRGWGDGCRGGRGGCRGARGWRRGRGNSRERWMDPPCCRERASRGCCEGRQLFYFTGQAAEITVLTTPSRTHGTHTLCIPTLVYVPRVTRGAQCERTLPLFGPRPTKFASP